MESSFGKQDRWIIRRSRLPTEPRSLAIGTIPVDPSDDAGDGGGNSIRVSPENRTTDPNGHTPVSVSLAGYHCPRYPPKSDGRPKSVIQASCPERSLIAAPLTRARLLCLTGLMVLSGVSAV